MVCCFLLHPPVAHPALKVVRLHRCIPAVLGFESPLTLCPVQFEMLTTMCKQRNLRLDLVLFSFLLLLFFPCASLTSPFIASPRKFLFFFFCSKQLSVSLQVLCGRGRLVLSQTAAYQALAALRVGRTRTFSAASSDEPYVTVSPTDSGETGVY